MQLCNTPRFWPPTNPSFSPPPSLLPQVRFAHPPATSFSYVGVVSPTFLLAAAMFTFTVQIFNVVLERETKLRSAMRVMGVSDGVWWTSWALWDVCVVDVLSALLICAFGAAFQFDLFLHNQFSVLFLHFWLFECSLTGLGYFLSTFVGKSNNATIAGFTIFLFGFIFQLVVTVSSVPFVPAYGGAWFGSVSGHGEYRWIQVIFSIFSPTVFAKGILDLGTASATPGQQSGIKWRTRDSYCYCDPSDPPVSAAGALASLGYAPPPAPPAPLGTPAAPTGAGLAGAPPAPPDFSYLFNNRKARPAG